MYWLIVLLFFFIFLAPNLFLKSSDHNNLVAVKSHPATDRIDVNNAPPFSDTKILKGNTATPAPDLIPSPERGGSHVMDGSHLSEVVPSQPFQTKKNAGLKDSDEYINDPILLHAPETEAVGKSPVEKPLPEVGMQTDSLISNPVNASPPSSSKTIKTLSVNVMGGRVRESPSLQSKIKYMIKKGTQVSVLKIDQDWFLISFNQNKKGWVHKSLFAEKKPVKTDQS